MSMRWRPALPKQTGREESEVKGRRGLIGRQLVCCPPLSSRGRHCLFPGTWELCGQALGLSVLKSQGDRGQRWGVLAEDQVTLLPEPTSLSQADAGCPPGRLP